MAFIRGGLAKQALAYEYFEQRLVTHAFALREGAGLSEIGLRQAGCDLDAAVLL
jgi:hypothetical protein